MKRSMILGVGVVCVLLLGQPAWAGGRGQQDNDELRAFRKIVRILDVAVNDDYHHRPKGFYVYQHRRYSRARVCYVDRGFRFCKDRGHNHRRNRHKQYDRLCRACR